MSTRASKKALLIIDMQKGSFTTASPRYQADLVIQRINELAQYCRGQKYPVLFIQHDGSKEKCFYPGTTEWEILAELEIKPSDLIISKTANNAFYKTDLEAKLKSLGVEELLLTGCATDFCVEATLQAALCKDYVVTVIADGHTTADRPYLTAQQVINHYNWVWQDLTPTKGKVQVHTTSKVIF